MLAPAEFGTREHILQWLAAKDPNESFMWEPGPVCACGQYSKESLGVWSAWKQSPNQSVIRELNKHAENSDRTWGGLYNECHRAWANVSALAYA